MTSLVIALFQSAIGFYALLPRFTRITMASGGDGNFQEYQIKEYDFEPLVTSDAAESSSSTNSEQFSDASSHRDGSQMVRPMTGSAYDGLNYDYCCMAGML